MVSATQPKDTTMDTLGFSPDHSATQPTARRWYAYTDNGDWMELIPQSDHDPLAAPGVSILVVEPEDEEDFYMRAGDGEGALLARVTIVGERPVLHRPDDLLATAGSTL